METVVSLILASGRTAVDLSLYNLLPIMIVMLALMKVLDSYGILLWLTRILQPLVKPFGITGLAMFAGIKVLFVSFAAPMVSLAIMDRQGASKRHMAAALALVMTMSQANASFPMVPFGLDLTVTLLSSVIGGLVAASASYYLFANKEGWDLEQQSADELNKPYSKERENLIDLLAKGGGEGLTMVLQMMPMLLLAIFAVSLLQEYGAIKLISSLLAPLLALCDLPQAAALSLVTKYIAGGTAYMGVTLDLVQRGEINAAELNRLTGLALNPLDLLGIALYLSVTPRLKLIARAAFLGALIGIALRAAIHLAVF